MLTTFEQVREWITDNGFKRWILYRDRSRTEKLLDSNAYPSNMENKLAMTEKYLRWNGGNAYAAAGMTVAASDLNTVCEIRLADGGTQGTQGVGGNNPSITEIEAMVEKKVRAEIAAEDFRRREKDLEKREREFKEQQNGVIGAIVNLCAPYLPLLNQVSGMRKVAGIDAEQPITAEAVKPISVEEPQEPEFADPEQPAETEEHIIPEADEEKWYALVERFVKAEPDALQMFEAVVKMAESKDPMYGTAKSFLMR